LGTPDSAAYASPWQQIGNWMRGHKVATTGLVVVALIAIGAAAGNSSNSATPTTAESTPTLAQPPAAAAPAAAPAAKAASSSSSVNGSNDPSKNATDTNIPRVGPSGSVEVDDLRWSLDSAKATSTIGDPSFLGARANGVFIVADLSVTNGKTGSVTISSDAVSLVADGKTYEGDTDAETALMSAGAKTFLLDDLGPGVALKGAVAFDVAPSVLAEHPQLRFNELGFGSTHGYISTFVVQEAAD
jgi:hypothetical protein